MDNIARRLLEKGADPARRLPGGETPLHRAAINNCTACAALLMQYRAPIDDADTRTEQCGSVIDQTHAYRARDVRRLILDEQQRRRAAQHAASLAEEAEQARKRKNALETLRQRAPTRLSLKKP